jgi:hypothetical protein
MLQRISWPAYGLTTTLLLIVYYYFWLKKYAPTLSWKWLKRQEPPADPRLALVHPAHANVQKETPSETENPAPASHPVKSNLLLWATMLTAIAASAQDGNTGINQANTMVRSYFDTGVNLMYAIGAIFGLIGAIRVYQRMSGGESDTRQHAAAWFGACIFLVLVATVIRSFFGL